jgi:hypothetical protein
MSAFLSAASLPAKRTSPKKFSVSSCNLQPKDIGIDSQRKSSPGAFRQDQEREHTMTRTLDRSPLTQVVIAAAALFGTAFSFGATTAPAYAAGGAYYEAQLAAPLGSSKTEIQNGVAWKCEGDSCRGSQGSSRAEIVCARLAREFGEVTAFAARGKALDAEALAKCNGDKAAPLARR